MKENIIPELNLTGAEYRLIVENAEDIICTLSREGTVLWINGFGCRFFGRPPESIIARSLRELFGVENGAVLEIAAAEVFDKNITRQLVCTASIADKVHWLEFTLSGLLDGAGSVYKVLGIGVDITQRKELETQMYNTEKLASMGTLVAGVAHEINNPLAIILGFSEMLADMTDPDSEQYDLIKTIEKQGNNAKRVVDNLLSFARHSEQKEEAIDINAGLGEIISIVKTTLKISGISIIIDMNDRLPAVRGNTGEFQQVFMNIINNALHAMKDGGVLGVITEITENGRSVVVKISDTGGGIPPENRSRVFDPLFTTKPVGEGTGLGLSISFGIITKYGGTITFETAVEGEADFSGTTFIITLPALGQI